MNRAALALLTVAAGTLTQAAQTAPQTNTHRLPVIDMHLHAFTLNEGETPPTNPVTKQTSAATTTAALRETSLAALSRYNIVKAVTSGPLETVTKWHEAAPDRIIPAVDVGTDDGTFSAHRERGYHLANYASARPVTCLR